MLEPRRVIVAVCLVSLLCACGRRALDQERAAAAGRRDRSVTVGYIYEIGAASSSIEVGLAGVLPNYIYEALLSIGPDGRPKPQLATAWEASPDRLTWRFHLRHGVRFHNGKELTSTDVKASYDPILREAERSAQLGFADVDRIDTEGRYELVVRMKRPSSFLLSQVWPPVKPADRLVQPLSAGAVGTGPFMVERWEPREVVLKANPDYYLGRPGIDRLVFRSYETLRLAWTRLVAGEIDCLYQVGPETQDFLERGSSVRLHSFQRPYYYLLGLNQQHDLFRDRRVRLALNYAINRKEIVRTVLRGHGETASGVISPSFWAYDADVNPYPYDPARALALLRQAGWRIDPRENVLVRDGRRFEFNTIFPEADSLYERVVLMIQKDLLNLGIRMNCKILTLDSLYARLFSRQFDAVLVDANGYAPIWGYAFFHSVDGLNPFSYANPQVDRTLDALRRTDDPDTIRALVARLQRTMVDDPPGVYLFWANRARAVSSRLTNLGPEGSDVLSAGNVRHWTISTETTH